MAMSRERHWVRVLRLSSFLGRAGVWASTLRTNPADVWRRAVMSCSQTALASLPGWPSMRACTANLVGAVRDRLTNGRPTAEPVEPIAAGPVSPFAFEPLHIADGLLAAHGADAFWEASLRAIEKLRSGDKTAFREWKNIADAVTQLEQGAKLAQAQPRSMALEQWVLKKKREQSGLP
jgi:hypothetical protein